MIEAINKWTKLRIILVGVALALLFLVMGGRFFQLQLIQGGQLREEAARETQKLCPVLAVRGPIQDCRGTELAISTKVHSVVAHPQQIVNAAQLSRELAPVLGIPLSDLTDLLTQPRPFAWVKRHLTPEKEEAFRAWKDGYEKRHRGKVRNGRHDREAIYLIPEARRYYPQQSLAGAVLGFCDIDGQGLEGLEHQFNQYLYGKPKKCWNMLDARGHIVVSGETAWDTEAMGHHLVLTLDRTLQYIAEKELARGVEHWQAAGGLILMVKPQTGDILAMAQYPTMDPNRYMRYPEEARRNRIVTDALEPGSTFKVFIAAAALDSQAVKPTDRFNCEGGEYYLGPNDVIHDAHPYYTLTVQQIIQKSSNIGTAKIAFRTGAGRLDHYLQWFGFGKRTNILFPGENAGLLKNLRRRHSLLDRATCAFGQGVSVTPLQLTMALAALGNEGMLMEPRLVKEIVSPRGEKVQEYSPKTLRQVISPHTTGQILEIMETVTQNGGTAKEAAVPGFTVAGKTGTAQKLVGRAYSQSKFNALFMGLIPSKNPVLAITVVIDEPKGACYGGVVAAPIFREVAAQSLRVLGYYPQPHQENHPVLAGLASLPSLVPSRWEVKKTPRSPALSQEPLKVMPDLRGLTIRQALDLLHRSGLHCRFEGTGRAVSQEPSPGTPISPGSSCEVKFQSHS
ncbi:MAG: penicillin-binding protein [Thermodesulfobacteriota bacterium]